MNRTTLYRHLIDHSRAGRAIQVSRGRWRAAGTEDPDAVPLTRLLRCSLRASPRVCTVALASGATEQATSTTTSRDPGEDGDRHLIYATASNWTLHVGDARNVLASMPEGYRGLHRDQPAVLGQARLRRPRAVRPGARPRRLHRHAAVPVPRGPSRARRRRDLLAQPGRLLLSGQCLPVGAACLPRARPGRADRTWHGHQEPPRPAVAGRPRPAGRRLDHPQRHRVAQAQRDAGVGPRPSELPVRADLPAR